jgi:phosphonate transport system ATP-binding protein
MGHTVLQDITLRVAPGERIALIGPSGAGKSTLIRLIAGALRPTAGAIEVNSQDMARFSWRALQRYRSDCRIVEQLNMLVPQATVHHNVVSGLLSTWPWYQVLRAALMPVEVPRIAALLQSLDMASHQWSKAGELSGGQMQRVAIARALIANPGLLLADEPTASLDPNTAKAVTRLIVDQAKVRGMALVFCTHWFDIVRHDCTRVIGLREGRVLFDCPPVEVTESRLAALYAGSDERI